jgi:hypothetical protein
MPGSFFAAGSVSLHSLAHTSCTALNYESNHFTSIDRIIARFNAFVYNVSDISMTKVPYLDLLATNVADKESTRVHIKANVSP